MTPTLTLTTCELYEISDALDERIARLRKMQENPLRYSGTLSRMIQTSQAAREKVGEALIKNASTL